MKFIGPRLCAVVLDLQPEHLAKLGESSPFASSCIFLWTLSAVSCCTLLRRCWCQRFSSAWKAPMGKRAGAVLVAARWRWQLRGGDVDAGAAARDPDGSWLDSSSFRGPRLPTYCAKLSPYFGATIGGQRGHVELMREGPAELTAQCGALSDPTGAPALMLSPGTER
jgi:hypothetical protein